MCKLSIQARIKGVPYFFAETGWVPYFCRAWTSVSGHPDMAAFLSVCASLENPGSAPAMQYSGTWTPLYQLHVYTKK